MALEVSGGVHAFLAIGAVIGVLAAVPIHMVLETQGAGEHLVAFTTFKALGVVGAIPQLPSRLLAGPATLAWGRYVGGDQDGLAGQDSSEVGQPGQAPVGCSLSPGWRWCS